MQFHAVNEAYGDVPTLRDFLNFTIENREYQADRKSDSELKRLGDMAKLISKTEVVPKMKAAWAHYQKMTEVVVIGFLMRLHLGEGEDICESLDIVVQTPDPNTKQTRRNAKDFLDRVEAVLGSFGRDARVAVFLPQNDQAGAKQRILESGEPFIAKIAMQSEGVPHKFSSDEINEILKAQGLQMSGYKLGVIKLNVGLRGGRSAGAGQGWYMDENERFCSEMEVANHGIDLNFSARQSWLRDLTLQRIKDEAKGIISV